MQIDGFNDWVLLWTSLVSYVRAVQNIGYAKTGSPKYTSSFKSNLIQPNKTWVKQEVEARLFRF
jgi:hypothetical protein